MSQITVIEVQQTTNAQSNAYHRKVSKDQRTPGMQQRTLTKPHKTIRKKVTHNCWANIHTTPTFNNKFNFRARLCKYSHMSKVELRFCNHYNYDHYNMPCTIKQKQTVKWTFFTFLLLIYLFLCLGIKQTHLLSTANPKNICHTVLNNYGHLYIMSH